MLNYIYRKILLNTLSHESKMKIANFFYKLPGFHSLLEKKYDFYPNDVDKKLSVTEQKNIYRRYLSKNGWEMNDLEKFFLDEPHSLVRKHLRYLRVYDKYFSKFRDNSPVTIVEVGVFGGGSLQMWKQYFGKNARVIGIDIDPRCKQYEEEQIEVFIGSQSDREFWKKFKKKVKKVDLFVDDGGHTMLQQRVTFEEMYDHISPNGVYICEDCATSYWPSMGGGYKVKDSFIEYSKNCIDYIHANYSKTNKLKKNNVTDTLLGIHFYDQMVVFEKANNLEENITISIQNE
jgi:cephalosporin hydroxylase